MKLISGPLFKAWPTALTRLGALCDVVVQETCQSAKAVQELCDEASVTDCSAQWSSRRLQYAVAALDAVDEAGTEEAKLLKEAFTLTSAKVLDAQVHTPELWAKAWSSAAAALKAMKAKGPEAEAWRS